MNQVPTLDTYVPPTQIVIDENTDMSKVGEKFGVRRGLIGIKVFDYPTEFEAWQREEPREIYEITPVYGGVSIKFVVTYAAGTII